MKAPLLAALLVTTLPATLGWAAGAADFTLPEVRAVSIPSGRVSIADFGAKPDGRTLNTQAFAKAIKSVASQGGGRVVVPRGVWKTGPIELESNIDLHVEQGAVVLFSGDLDHYRTPNGKVAHLISGADLENVAITGSGVFEGAGDYWRPVKEFKMTDKQWKKLLSKGGVLTDDEEIWWPSEEHTKVKRPRLVRLDDCRRVLIENATFRNSPSFSLDVSDCEDVTIRGVTVLNFWYAQNGDGIDLHSCKNVQIIGARVDVGDDALCMKSNPGKPLENVLVKDCTVFHGHGGFVIGSEELGGMNNLRVRDCTFIGTDVGLRFKSARDRGGLVTNVDIQNVNMIDIAEQAILFDMHYEAGIPLDKQGLVTRNAGSAPPAVTDTTPRFRQISIRDVTCRGAERAVLLAGLPEMPVQDVLLENVSITAKRGMVCMDAVGVELRGVEVLCDEGPALHVYNTRRLAVDDFRWRAGTATPVRVQGPQNAELTFSGIAGGGEAISLIEGAEASAVQSR
ncbi:Polygalacturonase [Posidoniimonas corsicana]|uniref:Polygalacturonase n=1 Tax=Posidoniimonas corsicana TaxID=1938618 RepID=A0A5C5VHB9_9BACT|nr:glycoside hydrolase family 28 protein [Posidoniimonas corsicana]TWT37125.1 Polygalacturonase [Posidoniimonas corsicana]